MPAEADGIRELKGFLERFRIIHGHFFYSKYGDVFPDARYITILRDPVERTISNYFHLLRSRDMNHKNYRLIVENKLDVVGFSELNTVSQAQSRFVKGRPIEDFTLVGLTEDMNTTVKLVRKVLGLPAYHPTLMGKLGFIPKTNVDYGRLIAQFRHGFITPSIKRKIRENVAPDWEIYAKAKERFEQLKREHL